VEESVTITKTVEESVTITNTVEESVTITNTISFFMWKMQNTHKNFIRKRQGRSSFGRPRMKVK
jgi:hypothetical protein